MSLDTARSSPPDWYVRTDRTWIDVFVERTDRDAAREFMKLGDRRLTYGQLRNEVDRLATGLIRAGVRPGATVAIWMTNSVEWVIAQWATYRAGCTLLPVSSYYRVPEALYALREAQATALFVRTDFFGKIDARGMVMELLPELAEARDVAFERLPSLQLVITDSDWGVARTRSFGQMQELGTPIDRVALDFARGRIAPTDVMNAMYTSGTTGFPKAGLSMHRNNMAMIECWSDFGDVDENEAILGLTPLFSNLGCMYSSGICVYVGGRLVLMERFDAERALEEIALEKVTYIVGAPEIYRMLFDHEKFALTDLRSLRSGHIGGSALDPKLAARIFERIPRAIPCFGLSECGGPNTVVSADDDPQRRLHSVGRPLPSVAVSVRHATTGAVLPPEEIGEIWLH